MKIFIDTSVFIWATNFPESNSAKIIHLANTGQMQGIVSEKVVEELKRYFINYHSERIWFETEVIMKTKYTIVPKENIETEIRKWNGKIKEKDLEHLATVKHLKLDTLIAFDRDYKPFPEYITPKQFMKKLGLKPSETEY